MSRKKLFNMEKSFDKEIIRRTLIALNLKNVNDIARLTGISQQNLNGYIKRGTFLKVVDSELYKRKINLDWIKTGQGNMMIEAPGAAPISEAQQPYSNSSNHKTSDLLIKTASVLESTTVFSGALKSNIEAFHTAIKFEAELDDANRKISDLENKMKQIEARLLPLEKSA